MSAIGTSCSQFVCSGLIPTTRRVARVLFHMMMNWGASSKPFTVSLWDAHVLLVSVFNCVLLGAFCLVMAELLIPGVVNATTIGIAIALLVAGWCPARALRSLIHVGGICILPMAASHAPSSPTSLARSWRYSAFLSALLNSGGAAANIEWASSP